MRVRAALVVVPCGVFVFANCWWSIADPALYYFRVNDDAPRDAPQGVVPSALKPTEQAATTNNHHDDNTNFITSPNSTIAVKDGATPIMGRDYVNNDTLNNINNENVKPVRIRLLLFDHDRRTIRFRNNNETWAISDELLNICMDGWKRSNYFDFCNATVVPDYHSHPNFVLQEDDDIVWVVDMRRVIWRSNYTVFQQVLHAANDTLQHQRQRGIEASLKVVFWDWRDQPEATWCPNPRHGSATRQLVSMLGVGNVRKVIQQETHRRKWNAQTNFVDAAQRTNHSEDEACFGDTSVLHMPYTVRSDYAQAVHEIYQSHLVSNATTRTQQQLGSPVDTIRTVDVAHFWRIQSNPRQGYKAVTLRNEVAKVILELGNANETHPLNVIGDYVSSPGIEGRTGFASAYAQALLTTKIVVVAQRDAYEDHYRLFEAFVGGALVLTDPMTSLPEGLVDGESIVVYNSLAHLKEVVLYYLDHEEERLVIARKGWEIAMARHRSFNWMEKIFFGRQLTPSEVV